MMGEFGGWDQVWFFLGGGAYEMGLKGGFGIGVGYRLLLSWVLLWDIGVKCLIYYCIVLA